MTNSADPDQTDQGLHSFVSPISPNIYFFTADNILNIMHNILRKNFVDMVSKG